MEKSFQHRPGNRGGINLVDLAAVVDVERLRAFRCNLRQKFTKLFAETEMRSNDCQRLRVEVGHVHCVTDRAFEQHGANRLRDFNAYAFLRFRRRCAEMRRKNNIGRTAQRRIGWQRFNFENIQRRACDLPLLQRLRQRRFIHQTAASAIDDADAALRFA
ncbi:MAG: hypothetical protein Udaeo_04650 [Candidatus Udaeobacter sp.]|nr:MAG: hypothetical protein Udaeo_04650 [Candidatus Udaeobacter sp.]